jgi:hypothetical protein
MAAEDRRSTGNGHVPPNCVGIAEQLASSSALPQSNARVMCR